MNVKIHSEYREYSTIFDIKAEKLRKMYLISGELYGTIVLDLWTKEKKFRIREVESAIESYL